MFRTTAGFCLPLVEPTGKQTGGGSGESCSTAGPGVAILAGPGREAELCSRGPAGRGQGRSSRQASGSLLESLHGDQEGQPRRLVWRSCRT